MISSTLILTKTSVGHWILMPDFTNAGSFPYSRLSITCLRRNRTVRCESRRRSDPHNRNKIPDHQIVRDSHLRSTAKS